MKLTVAQLQHTLDTLDNGVLSFGNHKEGERLFCALECVAKTRYPEVDVTDNPYSVAINMPDIRRLNDAFGTGEEADKKRTRLLLPLLAELSDWSLWSTTRKSKFAGLLAIKIVNQVVAELPGLSQEAKKRCKKVVTLKDATAAAAAARYAAAAAAAADAAAAAADAAAAAARYATRYAAAAAAAAVVAARYASTYNHAMLELAVAIFMESCKESLETV